MLGEFEINPKLQIERSVVDQNIFLYSIFYTQNGSQNKRFYILTK